MGRFMAWFIGWNMVLEYRRRRHPAWRSAGPAISSACCAISAFICPAAFANAPLAGTGIWRHASDRRHHQSAGRGADCCCSPPFWSSACSETARFNGIMVLVKVAIVVAGDPVRPALCAHGATSRPSFRPTRGVWGNSASAASWRRRAWSSSPISASRPCRWRRRKRAIPRRDIPIGILGSLGDLHRALHADGGGADRHHRLAHAGRANPGVVRGLEDRRPALAGHSRSTSARWSGLASVAFVSLYGQSARVLRHGARRLSAGRCSPPCIRAFSTPAYGTIIIGAVGGAAGGAVSARHAGRPGFHRHLAGVHRGVRRHHDPARDRAASAAAVPHAARLVRGAGRHLRLRRDDGQPVRGTWIRLVVWTAIGLGDLLRLRHPACRAVQMDSVERSLIASSHELSVAARFHRPAGKRRRTGARARAGLHRAGDDRNPDPADRRRRPGGDFREADQGRRHAQATCRCWSICSAP